jgi:hypothetical protein
MPHDPTRWQQEDPDRQTEWRPASPPRAVEGPLELTCFAGRCLVLELAPGQVVCRELDGRLQQVLLDGVHRLDVGEGRNRVSLASRLYFLRPDVGLDLRWRPGDSLVIDAAEPGREAVAATDRAGLRLPLRGVCRLHLADPMLFYRSVLQGLREPDPAALLGVLDALVREHLAGHLLPLVHRGRLDLLHAHTLLADLGPAELSDDLAEIGLGCLDLAVYTPLAGADAGQASEAAEAEPLVASYDDLL